ncbi:MAG: glycosyl hydrolase family 8 [Candidatus Methylacidiphilales bacterium]|nr:glycosyl hydrolase family 8 [Candidatus Methylacidiphilales bacterium]
MMCILGIPSFFWGCFSGEKAGTVTDREWTTYKARYLRPEGRIVDTGNGNKSHTEGQGYGMMLAEHYGDRAAFDEMWGWTKTHLARQDGLLSWSWIPDVSGTGGHVDDPNNASDGEVLVAWALIRASKRWPDSKYAAEAQPFALALAERLTVQSPHGMLLVPGLIGFQKEGGRTIVNLSYWIFPAFHEFRELTGNTVWTALDSSGRRLLGIAKYGKWKLPPDWLFVDEIGAVGMPPKEQFPQEFGYNAFRIPLYLAWAGQASDEALLKPFVEFWSEKQVGGRPVATVGLDDDEPADYAAPPGEEAIYLLAQAVLEKRPLASIRWPGMVEGDSYYSATLLLLAKAAASDLAK